MTYKFQVTRNGETLGRVYEIKAETHEEAELIFKDKAKKEILSRYTFSEIVRENGEEVFKKINL